jgi:hypothetical protein
MINLILSLGVKKKQSNASIRLLNTKVVIYYFSATTSKLKSKFTSR